MKNKKIISLTAMSLVMGSTIATANADSIVKRFRDPVGVSENVQAEEQALQSGDYQVWKAVVLKSGNTKILETVNEGNFAKYVEAFNLRESGDLDGARAVMEELGVKEPPRHGGRMKGLDLPEEDLTTLELAMENIDYNAWKTVMEKVGNDKLKEYLTEEKFNLIVRAYKLQASGDRAGAMTLIDDSDIPGFMLISGGRGKDGDRGEMDGADESKQAALMAAYTSSDFASWKALMEERGGGKILEIVNADNFAQFAEVKILQSEGKTTEAKAILDELGFPFQERGGRSMRQPALPGANAN